MDVFVYGTLTDPDTAAGLLDQFEYRGTATVRGLRRVDGRYPTLVPGGTVDGRLLSTPEQDALDAYEGVDRGLYYRCTIPRAAAGSVDCYVGDPAKLGVDVEWPGEGEFTDRVDAYVRTNGVVVSIDS
jgi:gamma-glutamylcyclotransferase (GGCT)/AIG2-like uncharacterized protein YtfP